MSGARVVSAGLAFAVCALFGAVKKARQRRERETAAMLAEDISDLERMLRLEVRPISELAKRLAKEGRCVEFWNDIARKTELGASFSEAYPTARKPEAGKTALAVLGTLAEGLGSGDAEGEASRLKKAGEELAAVAAQMQKNGAEKDKLTGTLSWLIGLAAALLII